MSETIRIKYIDSPHLEKIAVGDWIDLYVAEDFTLHAGEFKYVSLGVAMQLPEGYEANIIMRSSTFKRTGLIQTNAIGEVDSTYSGDDDVWMLPVYATRDVTVTKGTRLCQFRINKVQPDIIFEEVEHLGNPARGGLGSTGN